LADKDKKRKRKLEQKAKDKKQGFANPFTGMPVQDDRLPDFEVSGNFNSKGYNVKDVKFDLTQGIGDNVNVAYGRGSRRVNMTRSTLEKSRATLIGMAPQQNRQGKTVQGFNYANPNYTNAVENNRKLQDAKAYYGVGSVRVDKRTQFENNRKKVQNILDARVAVASLPDALKGGAVEDAIKNKPYEQTEQEKINQAGTNARLKQASRNKVKNALANIGKDPTVGYANQIQGELGRGKITLVVKRRRRGRWSTSLSADPKKIINDYHTKTALINWAKEVDPDHAKVNPDLTMDVVASSKYKTIQTPVYRRGRNSGMSYRYHVQATHTYKTVNRKDTMSKGDTMDWLYAKINTQAESKKKRYEKYYRSDPNVETYNYYGITDDEFSQMDSYKSALVTNIRDTRDAKYALQNKIIGTHRVDATTPLDDNAPKQKYIQYQKTGKDDFITPTVQRLQSQITPDSNDADKLNLQNAIAFVEGKARRFEIDGVKIASRDNFGRIKILDNEAYSKYIKNTPSEYLKQPDKLDSTVIPELDSENEKETENYNEIEKEYYRKERAKAQFAGTNMPKCSNVKNAKRRR